MKAQLRNHIRKQRRNVSSSQKTLASQQLATFCCAHEWVKQAQHIACFLDNDGEIETRPLISQLLDAGKSVYLPVLHPDKTNQLLFLSYQHSDLLKPNRFGILEPDMQSQSLINNKDLDLVLMPLVAFDQKGHRLGMGGGYYDRSFAFSQTEPVQKPRLAGIAYSFQQVDHLEPESWDLPLAKVFTEHGVVNSR